MNKELIFISDFTHTATGTYATNLIPYPIASIKSHLLHFSKYSHYYEVRIFKDPQKFITSYLNHKPALVGLSNYVWNLELSYAIAKEIKQRHPDTLIVSGGPNFPLDYKSREEWLQNHPYIDIYIIGEAEEPFTKVVDVWHETHNIEKVKTAGIMGCYSLIDGKLCKAGDISPRIQNLDDIPSPYLQGYLDEFLEDPKLSPLLESNRGCPFSCTFCVDGIKERSKVYNKSVERFEKELEYIAQRYKGKVLTLADLNFGMYARDIEISNTIAKVKEKYNYPYYIQVSTGKNNKPRVLECAKILKGSMSLAASVQSLDKDVLLKIKRNNISEQELVEMTRAGNDMSANTYSEVILALPGDSKEKHMQTVLKLADADMKLISMYQCMVLEGSELGSRFSRQLYQIGTKFRVLPRCFGIYDFDGKEILAAEIEEICVTTDSLSLEDYYECRSFALTEGLFYQDRILFELYRFLRNFDIKPSDMLPILHSRRMELSPEITDLYHSFDKDTRTELWDSREELQNFITSDKSVIQRYIKGELGINVLFKHRAIATLQLADIIHEVAFQIASELLKKKDLQSYEIYKQYLLELQIFSTLRKRNVFDFEKTYKHSFTYDFKKLTENDFEGFPEKLEPPVTALFYTTEEQKEMIKVQLIERGSDILGIGKILSRTLGSMLQRNVDFHEASRKETTTEKMMREIKILEKDVGINQSPGEFV